MDNLRDELQQFILIWLEHLPGASSAWFEVLVVLWLAVCAVVLHVILHFTLRRYVAHLVTSLTSKLKGNFDFSIISHAFFKRCSFIFQGVIVQAQATLWLEEGSTLLHIIKIICGQWFLLFTLLALFSLLDIFQGISKRHSNREQFPIKGLLQTIKLVASILMGLLAVSLLIGKSPLILLSGLGALSAVMMLIFKDSILGLVAGVQLSANNMLAVGDWLEMPKYGADGDVIDIALTTVKVRNWDKTITTIPAYALISDSFKNWQGMTDAGGRRIKRSILIEISSIRFLDEALLTHLNKVDLIGTYLNERRKVIEEDNNSKKLDMSVLTNGRRLTNIGTFRHYLLSYLKKHSGIHQNLTLMVRQLDPTPDGLPLEIYAFTNTTSWSEYEGIQADIFDHIFSILQEFDLRVHEAPTGHDIRSLHSTKN